MNHTEETIQLKKQVLRETITGIKSFTIELNDDLDNDKKKLKNLSIAYEHSDNLLQKTNKELDKLLSQSEVRLAIYIGGISLMLFTMMWKFIL